MSREVAGAGFLQAIVFSLAVGLSGCSSFGPRTVPTDKFDYNGAIAESQQQELLLNLVRLRYSEPPVFLKVSSVISQYSLSAATTVGGGINTGLTGNDTANVGGRVGWSDRPVITYTPVSGQEFSRNLLTPLQLRAIASAFTAGRWFYIENTDMASKQAFSFLQLLLSLAETATQDRAPILTISN